MTDQTTLPAEKQRATGVALAPFVRLRDEIDRLFDDFPFAQAGRSVFPFTTRGGIVPAMELAETDDGYALTIELPGLEEKDIDIEFADGTLTISGEKHEAAEKKDKGYLLSERRYGAFRRQLTLPPDADPATIEARFRHGVLTLGVKKDDKAPARTRKIKIG